MKVRISIQTLNLTIQNDSIMASIAEITALLQQQSQILTAIDGNVSGIRTDVTNLKTRIAELEAGNVTQEQIDELAGIAAGIGTQIDNLNTATATLDQETP